jgi:hypothetical protein
MQLASIAVNIDFHLMDRIFRRILLAIDCGPLDCPPSRIDLHQIPNMNIASVAQLLVSWSDLFWRDIRTLSIPENR